MNHFLAAALALYAVSSTRAEMGRNGFAPGLPVRELTVRSDAVVVAVPAGPAHPDQFRVRRVLMGLGLKDGDILMVDGLSSYDLTIPPSEGDAHRKTARPAEVLLFLGPPTADPANPRRTLVESGLRIRTAEGTVYHLDHEHSKHLLSSNEYYLAPYRASVRWEDLVQKVAADAAEIRHIRSLKAISDPHRRNEALLDWVERRRAEFGAGLTMDYGEEPSFGWGSLEVDVFQWVFESGIPADCWAAVTRYAELNHGNNPWLRTPAFGTAAVRRLLLSVAADDNALAGNRIRALKLLALPATLWPPQAPLGPPGGAEPIDAQEQGVIIDAVSPLLKSAHPPIRAAAAGALLAISSPKPDPLESYCTDRALPALKRAYQIEPPGGTRDALAEAVAVVAGPTRLRELSGNARGVVAVLEPDCDIQADLGCWLAVLGTRDIHDIPTLVLERLDDKHAVVEKKEQSLDALHLALSEAVSERIPDYSGYFKFSMDGFAPGLWRMTVKGVASDDKSPWTSEPRLLRLAPPPPPGQPNPNPTALRITFDP